MPVPAFEMELGDYVSLHTVKYKLCPNFWESFAMAPDVPAITLWREAKFLNNRNELHSEMGTLPGDKGGIYLFTIRGEILGYLSDYLAYIGRAQLTSTMNLKKRCRSYLTEYKGQDPRPKVKRMIKNWGQHLYVRYFVIDDNTKIEELEKALINSLLPPFCDQIPDKRINRAVRALP